MNLIFGQHQSHTVPCHCVICCRLSINVDSNNRAFLSAMRAMYVLQQLFFVKILHSRQWQRDGNFISGPCSY